MSLCEEAIVEANLCGYGLMCTNPCNHAFDLDGSSTWRTTLRVGKNFCKYGSYAALVVLLAANALNDVAGLEAHLVGWIQAVVSLGGDLQEVIALDPKLRPKRELA